MPAQHSPHISAASRSGAGDPRLSSGLEHGRSSFQYRFGVQGQLMTNKNVKLLVTNETLAQ